MLPTFLVIGAMKAGTSSLHRYLGGHPEVFVPDEKEPDFFPGVSEPADRFVPEWGHPGSPEEALARHRGKYLKFYRSVKGHVPKRLRHAAWSVTCQPVPQPEPVAPSRIELAVLDELLANLRRPAALVPGLGCPGGLLDDGGRRR